MSCKIVVHGGAGGTSPRARREVEKAARKGMGILQQDGGSALDAVIAAVVHMENIDIFNAGVGSILREDGVTIEMDAAVATFGELRLQAGVGAIRGVKHPVLLALKVAEDRNVRFLSGEGATEMAKHLGLDIHPGPSENTTKRWERMQSARKGGEKGAPLSGGITSDGAEKKSVLAGNHDTVGALALDAKGMFALASSTGGSGIMPVGRVGDVPIEGDGFQIGNRGGVLATGAGEVISELHGSRRVYQRLQGGMDAQMACEETIAVFPKGVDVGFITLTKCSIGIATAEGCPMAVYSMIES